MCCPQARVGEAKVHWGTICDSMPWEENKREEGEVSWQYSWQVKGHINTFEMLSSA